MRTALVVTTDGRVDYLDQAIESLRVNLLGQIGSCILVNDEPEAEHLLVGRYPDFHLVSHPKRRGLAGAVRSAWTAAQRTGASYVFHMEDDFVFNEPVDITNLRVILEANGELAQVVLKRQAWNDEEKRAGGIIECHPHHYTDRDGFIEHGRIFSLNPCLIPVTVVDLGWPDGNEAEFTQMCLQAGLSFAFYGQRDDPPRVTHIGDHRSTGWAL